MVQWLARLPGTCQISFVDQYIMLKLLTIITLKVDHRSPHFINMQMFSSFVFGRVSITQGPTLKVAHFDRL